MTDKIDFVITYLDGADPEWMRERNSYRASQEKGTAHENGESRYRNMNNFHFLLRSMEKFAPWVNKIHIVTWGHVPEWLNTEHPKINVVKHEEFIPKEYLPTFNSNAIEFHFDRIPGISETFVNFNDDMFLNSLTKPEDFFVNGLPSLQLMHAPFMPSDALFSNNILALNKVVDSKHLISKKMFSLKNGLFAFLSNIYILPMLKFYGKFLGFREDHLPAPMTKTQYKELREKLPEYFEFVGQSKFRNSQDIKSISDWLMLDYARATNQFSPMNSFKFGSLVNLGTDINFEQLFKSNYKILCLEDGDFVAEEDFEGIVEKMNTAFAQKFPNKSGFEK
ncbi:glycosyl transferase [Lactococcus garvieae]|uniref:Exopolysaccharide phosphotransferase cps2G n=2 Tax=Lactococcus garvieae TaxID=1363 RepID=A0A6L2ZT26_9LACT|nr:stealth family protein [Lactococcus garvieae]ETD03929.1 glycosyl transferase [Lactococcus garvieae TRF1]MDH7959804.1 stealth family protein [Lactococcus garvieae]QQC74038.1 glycosyl transferase [Lactococcus garvieae]BDM75171.1 exopolysaccharide phosphotransferase cps2G [Lactococcus garvieae]BDW46548.1 exopolysaccharide phosphotransferase cps2G [Lactococcus garvieae]